MQHGGNDGGDPEDEVNPDVDPLTLLEAKTPILLDLLDGYGARPHTDPRVHQKSILGAILTTIMRAVVIYLLVMNTMDILSDSKLNVQESRKVVYNSFCDTSGSAKIYDIPSLVLQTITSVTFYEKDKQTLQKIVVQDDFGYDYSRITGTAKVPVSKGVYNTFTVPLNSFDRNMNNIRSHAKEQSETLSDLFHYKQLRAFIESSKAIQFIVLDKNHSTWFDHTAVLYVRLTSEVLRTKACQLQVAMVNTGQYNTLSRAGVMGIREAQGAISAMATSEVNWKPRNFRYLDEDLGVRYDAGDYNAMYLTKKFTRQMYNDFSNTTIIQSNGLPFNLKETQESIATGSFVDWKIMLNYVNNFNFTNKAFTCDKRTSFELAYTTLDARNVTTSANAFQVGEVINAQGGVSFPAPGSFYVVFRNMFATEKVFVSDFNTTSTRVPTVKIQWITVKPVTKTFLPTFAPNTSVPEDWECASEEYFKGDGVCNCGCGSYDPDCLPIPYGTYNSSIAKGCNATKPYCDRFGLCNEHSQSPEIQVSEGCSILYVPGENVLLGYSGSEEDYLRAQGPSQGKPENQCLPCPRQAMYDGKAVERAKDEWRCGFKPTMIMDSRFQMNRMSVAPSGTSNDQVSGRIIMKKMQLTGLPEGTYATPLAAVVKGTPFTHNINITSAEPFGPERPDLQYVNITHSNAQWAVAQAELVSYIGYDTTELYVAMPKPNQAGHDAGHYWFWERGPYSVWVQGMQYRISSASNISAAAETNKGNVQKLKLMSSLPTSTAGFKASLSANIAAGALEVTVDHLTLKAGLEDYHLLPPLRMMLIDTVNGHTKAEAITVNALTWNSDTQLKLTLASGTINGWDTSEGTTVQCGTTTTRQDATAYTSVYVELADAWKGSTEYDPASRYTSQKKERDVSPATLNIETQLFVVPEGLPLSCSFYDREDEASPGEWVKYCGANITGEECAGIYLLEPLRNNLLSSNAGLGVQCRNGKGKGAQLKPLLNLCPDMKGTKALKRPVFRSFAWEDWKIKDTHQLNVSNCELFTSFSMCVEPASEYYTEGKCLKTMPPQLRLEFSSELPINNKWIPSVNTPDSLRNDPEFSFSFSKVFTFTFDHQSHETEEQWVQGILSGDVTAQQELKAYGATYNYRGVGASTGKYFSTAALMPADTPKLKEDLLLMVSPSAVADVLGCRIPPIGWPSGEDTITSLMEIFEPLTMSWDLTSVMGMAYLPLNAQGNLQDGIPMQPGFGYVLSATIQIRPQYAMEGAEKMLVKWTRTITSKSAVRYALPYGQGNLFRLTYNIQFDEDVFPSLEQNQFSFNVLLVSYGAVFGYYIVGLVALLLMNSIGKAVNEFVRRDAVKSMRSMKAMNITDEYLMQLIDYVGTVSVTDHSAMQQVYNNQRTTAWTPIATYEALAKAVDGKLQMIIFQILHQASIDPEVEMVQKHGELLAAYKQETRKGPNCDLNTLWMAFWEILGEVRMYPILYVLLKKDYVDNYRKNAKSHSL